MEAKNKYIDALRSITSNDIINYVSIRYIDVYGYEVKRIWKKNNPLIYQPLTPQELLTVELMEVYYAFSMISLEVRYTNKHGYPCSILKFE